MDRYNGMVVESKVYLFPGISNILVARFSQVPFIIRMRNLQRFCSHDSDWHKREWLWLLDCVPDQDDIAWLNALQKQQLGRENSLDCSVVRTS